MEFRTADHSACLQEGWTAVWQSVQRRAEEALTASLETPLVKHAHQLQRATKTGAWLTVQPSEVNGTKLGAQEWRDALFLRYGLEPQDLPTHCEGCQSKFSISHSLDCKKGGLVTARHNELHDGVAYLAGKAFTPSHMRNDPLIHSGFAVKRTKATPARDSGKNDQAGAPPPEVTDQKGDLIFRDLWQNGTDSVHDMRVVNTDAKSHRTKEPKR